MPERAEDALAVEVEIHVRALAELVANPDEVRLMVAVGRERVAVRRHRLDDGRGRVELDRVRQDDRLMLAGEMDLGAVAAVLRDHVAVGAAVPPEHVDARATRRCRRR